MRIKETCVGYLDLDHVQSVSHVFFISDEEDSGWLAFEIFLMFRDTPLQYKGEWHAGGAGTEAATRAIMKIRADFIAQWQGN